MLTIQALKPRAHGISAHPPVSPSSTTVETLLLDLVSVAIAEVALDCLGSSSCWFSSSLLGEPRHHGSFLRASSKQGGSTSPWFLCLLLQPLPYSCLQKQSVLSPGLSHNLVPLGSGLTHYYFNCLYLNKI